VISRIKWKRDQIFEKVSQMKFGYFFPNFGKPPFGARISIKLSGIMNLSKFWKCDLPSEIYFMKKCLCQNAFLPFKLPSKFRYFSPC